MSEEEIDEIYFNERINYFNEVMEDFHNRYYGTRIYEDYNLRLFIFDAASEYFDTKLYPKIKKNYEQNR